MYADPELEIGLMLWMIAELECYFDAISTMARTTYERGSSVVPENALARASYGTRCLLVNSKGTAGERREYTFAMYPD
jgi:hypothetical protein